jgi:ribonuclease J
MANPKDEFVFLPLGGAGEFGRNLHLFGFGPPGAYKWIILDCGVGFDDGSLLGLHVSMSDPKYINERRADLLGLIVTHGHEDHLGAIPYLWPALRCPVYAMPLAATMLRRKLAEAGLHDVPLLEIDSPEFAIGPFLVRYLGITHSIPESNCILLKTSAGAALHTGDWKLDDHPLIGKATDGEMFKEIGKERIDALICDSTNVFVNGRSGSEQLVRDELIRLLNGLQGRVAITAFATNLARLESAIDAGAAHGRKTVLLGRSMVNMISAARENGFLPQLPELCSVEEAAKLAPNRVLYVCTGSQGQPRSALDRISREQNRDVSIGQGDTVIFSSRAIPGNAMAVAAIQNRLSSLGVSLITDSTANVHVSGHPCRGELADMYKWVNPRMLIPVHGEHRHLLEHERFAKTCGIEQVMHVTNGTLVRIAPEPVRSEVVCEVGRLFLDGELLVPSTAEHLGAREKMGDSGIIAVVVNIETNGRLGADPILFIEGVPEDVAEELRSHAITSIRASKPIVTLADEASLKANFCSSMSRYSVELWGKTPSFRLEFVRVGAFKHSSLSRHPSR